MIERGNLTLCVMSLSTSDPGTERVDTGTLLDDAARWGDGGGPLPPPTVVVGFKKLAWSCENGDGEGPLLPPLP